MGLEVVANGRSILHKGHGMTHVCAVPDVCKTPTPGGPVPIPYINIAMDSDLQGTKSVKIGGTPVANVAKKIVTSTGDEPGSVGGIISSRVKGTMTWKMGSLNVKAEGKMVVRLLDTAFHNGNTFNTSFMNQGGTGAAYADDFDGNCPICDRGPRQHRILETPSSAALCAQLVQALLDAYNNANGRQAKKRYAKHRRGDEFGGYMVGVMICKHEPGQSFAAMSGNSLEGFDEVAAGIVDHVVSGGGATREEMIAANTSAAATNEEKAAAIGAAWDNVEQIRQDPNQRAGYNYPGACAGAKLLARAGHAPLMMTEMFFLPPWSARYRWRVTMRTQAQLEGYTPRWRQRILQNQAARNVEVPFFTGETVASCHTCQELLYMMNCPVRSC